MIVCLTEVTWHGFGVVGFLQHEHVDESVFVQEEQATVDAPLDYNLLVHRLVVVNERQIHVQREPEGKQARERRQH